jgi:hypothetical protein
MTIFNAAHAEIMGTLTNADIDHENYEEIRQVALDLETDMESFSEL